MLRRQEKMNQTLPEELLQEMRQLFTSVSSQLQPLALHYLPMLFYQLKFQIPQSMFKEYTRLMTVRPEPKFTLKQFSHMVARVLVQEQIEEELKNLFALMDRDRDGYLSAEDLFKIITQIDSTWTQQDVDQLVTQIDSNHVGYVTYEDLVFALLPK